MKKPSNLWRYVFLIFLLILLYQFHSSWDKGGNYKSSNKNVPDDSVIFLTIEEHPYGAGSRGFDSLLNSLHSWEFDEKNKKVKLKFKAYLPQENAGSKVLFVYDRGFSSYEKYVDVVSVSAFPYQYRFKDKPLVEIHHVDKEGNLYFYYKGKKIELKPGQSHQSFGISDFRLSRTKITNHGFYKKSDFSLFDSKEKN